MKSKEEIIRILSEFKSKNKDLGIISLGLFGSCARGEQKETSDIDVCIKFDKVDFVNFLFIKDTLSSIFGCEVDLISMHKYLDAAFVKSINRDVIYV